MSQKTTAKCRSCDNPATEFTSYENGYVFSECFSCRKKREDVLSESFLRQTEPSWIGCPCLHTVPCSPQCSCATPVMSGGCSRCCSYGSAEQRHEQAERLTRNPDVAIKAAEIAALEWAADKIDTPCGEAGMNCERRWSHHHPRCRRSEARVIRAEIERRKGAGE